MSKSAATLNHFALIICTELMLIREAPTPVAVVAFYAYMSHSLPGYIGTPHHVFKFDVVRTNIRNGYHFINWDFFGTRNRRVCVLHGVS